MQRAKGLAMLGETEVLSWIGSALDSVLYCSRSTRTHTHTHTHTRAHTSPSHVASCKVCMHASGVGSLLP